MAKSIIKKGCGLVLVAVAGVVMIVVCGGILNMGGTDPSPDSRDQQAGGREDVAAKIETPVSESVIAEETRPEAPQVAPPNKAPDPKPEPVSEFAIDNWKASNESDRHAYYVALRRSQGREDESVTNTALSIGKLKRSFTVISIPKANTLQVDFGDFGGDIAFLENINTAGLVDGDERHLDAMVAYAGTVQYTTVLGATKTVHSYRVLGRKTLAEADRIYAMMQQKQAVLDEREAQAKREQRARRQVQDELLKLIAQMRQNLRGDYDRSIRIEVAQKINARLDVFGNSVEGWPDGQSAKFKRIIEEIRTLSAGYAGESIERERSSEKLRQLMNEVKSLYP
ncbi:MAG: hypothetical protein AAGC72_01160 [Planctomycetota bacterium]